MMQEFLNRAERGEHVFLPDVRAAFSVETSRIQCVLELVVGGERHWEIRVPAAKNAAEAAFVREYCYANLYNLISTFGGKRMRLYVSPMDSFSAELCKTLDDVFQVHLPKRERRGYGKCLNVTDRINAAMGEEPFSFQIVLGQYTGLSQPRSTVDALASFRSAVDKAQTTCVCGIDIGGTDIKVVGIRGGRIVAVKEYDWFPAEMIRMEQIIDPILLMARMVRTAMSLPDTADADALREQMLRKGASDEEMRHTADACRERYGEPLLLDGIGVCFPDVVIDDRIVGGETYKTRGIRSTSPDYEAEFSKLSKLKELLLEQCRPGGKVHMANDGALAAYTAAVELAHSEQAGSVASGVFAHTLGTELGTGWIDETGEIPQIPLEVYNCIIDLGNYPARAYHELDARSVNNFNTGLSGTLQKYCSQSGAYRLALRLFKQEATERFAELFDLGFLQKRDGGVYVAQSPADMRKPLLEYLMRLAAEGDPTAEMIFRQIGEYLAVTFEETEWMLAPKSKQRVLFGRFVKHKRCSELLQEGANARNPVQFVAGDGNLAYTPLMLDLKQDPVHTVAQFGQAVGAAYFAASQL
jgi:hypothetical protein